MKWRAEFFLITFFFLIIFPSCGTKDAIKISSEEEVLEARVMGYWNHKINQEFDKSYEYEYPLFRKTVSLVNYIRSFNTGRASWTRASVERIAINGENASVEMKIGVNIVVSSSQKLEHETILNERWVKVDGIWYHVPAKFRESGGSH